MTDAVIDAAQPSTRPPCSASVPHGGRADLLRRVREALQLAGRALQAAARQGELDTRTPGATPGATVAQPADPDGVRPLVLAKVMAEAAMLARCAGFLRDDAAVAAALDGLARDVAPHARGEAVLAQLCREPFGAIQHAAAHVYLSDLGHRDEPFDRLLESLLDSDTIGGPERLPNHTLECHWLDQIRSGAAQSEPIDPALLACTCVALPLDALGSSTLDLYAFTHVLLYASDMGRRAAPWPRAVDEMAADAEAALAAALDADNFDLAAELLWTWPMLGLAWSPAAQFAFEVLASAQDEHGFLPGPQYVPALAAGDFVLRTSYHATLVMGMLCAAALRPGRAPSARVAEAVSADGGDLGCIDRLLSLLPILTRTPRWLALQSTLPPARRAELAPWVLNVVFRRSAALHDLPRLRDGLQAALDAELTQGPAVQQALALLRRATALAGFQRHTAPG